MTLVKRGSLRMGVEKQDSLWGKSMPVKDISVDGFWMDETEVTNSQYKQFVHWVRDSILRTRLADPSYGGDESYMITEDKNGDPVTPHLNWNKRLHYMSIMNLPLIQVIYQSSFLHKHHLLYSGYAQY